MSDSPWPMIHAERKALAEDLADLSAERWKTPSLCTGWDVHQVLAHQVSTAKMTPLKFFGSFAGSGFSFDKFADKGIAGESAGGPAATLAAFRAVEGATSSPPGPKDSWLGEALIHGEDIRRPLGITRDYPIEAVTRTLDFYKGSNLVVGTKKRIEGVTLKATDADWSHGTGPVAEGPAMSLLLAATGRAVALADLSGPGVDVLRTR